MGGEQKITKKFCVLGDFLVAGNRGEWVKVVCGIW